MRILSGAEWTEFVSILVSRSESTQELLRTAPFRGRLDGPFDYALSDDLLELLRNWLDNRAESEVYLFLTEYSSGCPSRGFAVATWELDEDALRSACPGLEKALVALDHSWAIFLEASGAALVCGPQELFRLLVDKTDASVDSDEDQEGWL